MKMSCELGQCSTSVKAELTTCWQWQYTLGHVLVALLCLLLILPAGQSKHSSQLDVMVDNMTLCTAELDYSYRQPQSNTIINKSGILAR